MFKRKKNTLTESASDFTEGILPALGHAVETARDRAVPLLNEARDKAAPIIAEAREKAGPMLTEAGVLASEKAHEAREKAGPIIAEGRARAIEKAHEAREAAAPIIAEGRARAAEKAAEGKIATVAKVNELRGIEPEPKKGGKLKKVLFLGVLAGIGTVVYKKLTGGSAAGDNWQSSYVPAPAATPAAPAPVADKPAASDKSRDNDDAAAATPDEALSDAADAPVKDTTPDAPVEVVELNDDKA